MLAALVFKTMFADMLTWRTIAVVILCCVSSCHGSWPLLNDLFENYNNEVRSICRYDAPIEVKVGMAIRQILDLNEAEQSITAKVWIRLQWYDCKLIWHPGSYGDFASVTIPYRKIWTPDITHYENAGYGLPGVGDFRPTVHSNGTVIYNFPTIIKSVCQIDVTSFPFDTQSCSFSFGTWSYHEQQVNITSLASEADITSFKPNSEWDLVGVPVERHVVRYGCCPEPYPDVTFYITLSRKPLFFVCSILFPCLLLSVIALVGFVLPPDSGEKVSLEIIVFLCLSIFMLVVLQVLPPTSENFPIIGIFFCVLMALLALSTILNVIVINVHFRGQLGHRVPQWMRKVFIGNQVNLMSSKVVENSPEQNDEKNEVDQIKDEWKRVAVTMDRLFFLIVLILLVLCTVVPILVMIF